MRKTGIITKLCSWQCHGMAALEWGPCNETIWQQAQNKPEEVFLTHYINKLLQLLLLVFTEKKNVTKDVKNFTESHQSMATHHSPDVSSSQGWPKL